MDVDDGFGSGDRTAIACRRARQGDFTRDGGDDVDLDTVFDLLRDQRRRLLLRFFIVNRIEAAEFDEIASYIQKWESRLDDRPVSRDDVELALVHNHLPRLERAGVVDVDCRAATVRYRSSETVERILGAAIDTSAIP